MNTLRQRHAEPVALKSSEQKTMFASADGWGGGRQLSHRPVVDYVVQHADSAWGLSQIFENGNIINELLVRRVVKPRAAGKSIFRMEYVRCWGVVDDDDSIEVAAQQRQVLRGNHRQCEVLVTVLVQECTDLDEVAAVHDTVLTEQACRHSPLAVEQINNGIGILESDAEGQWPVDRMHRTLRENLLQTGREDNDLE